MLNEIPLGLLETGRVRLTCRIPLSSADALIFVCGYNARCWMLWSQDCRRRCTSTLISARGCVPIEWLYSIGIYLISLSWSTSTAVEQQDIDLGWSCRHGLIRIYQIMNWCVPLHLFCSFEKSSNMHARSTSCAQNANEGWEVDFVIDIKVLIPMQTFTLTEEDTTRWHCVHIYLVYLMRSSECRQLGRVAFELSSFKYGTFAVSSTDVLTILSQR